MARTAGRPAPTENNSEATAQVALGFDDFDADSYEGEEGGSDLAAILSEASQYGRAEIGEQISGAGNSFPIYSVVGVGAKDAMYKDGKLQISRSGNFRHPKQEGVDPTYSTFIGPAVILEARVAQALFTADNKVACRGISARQLYEPRCTGGIMAERFGVGFSCEACPFYQFRKDQLHPDTGLPIKDEEKCNGSLNLYVWFPKTDPKGEAISIVNFSSSSMPAWRGWAKRIEDKAKVWGVWCAIGTKHNPPKEANQSAFFTPDIIVKGVIPAEKFELAESIRDGLLGKIKAPDLLGITKDDVKAALPSGAVSIALADDPFKEE